jgi:hypothetical protein
VARWLGLRCSVPVLDMPGRAWQEEREKGWLGDASVLPRDGVCPAARAGGGWTLLQQGLAKILAKKHAHMPLFPSLQKLSNKRGQCYSVVRPKREGWVLVWFVC